MSNGVLVCERSGADAAAWAEQMARQSGGPAIRAIVLVDTEAPASPSIESRYPRLVIRMSRASAIGYAVPNDWDRFFVVELHPQLRVTACSRNGKELCFELLNVSNVEDLDSAGRILGMRRCAVVSDTLSKASAMTHPFERMEMVSGGAWVEGGNKYALALLEAEGVSHDGHTSTLALTRSVRYSIHRPLQPVFDPSEKTLADVVGSRPLVIAADGNVASLYREDWRNYAKHHLHLAGEFIVDATEESKKLSQVEELCSYMAQWGLPRDGMLVAVGGGITLDMVGFAASIFRRGISYVRVPTSLVGLIDVAVGIKQGVNSHDRKNLLGSFYPPVASINDYRFLRTLPRGQMACGMAEILKVALLRDPELLAWLEESSEELIESRFSRPAGLARKIAIRSELLMLEELAPNLYEASLMRLVDFGHTFSPAIELGSGFRISHGEAVAMDMLLSTALAVVLRRGSEGFMYRLAALLDRLGLPLWSGDAPPAQRLFDALEDVKRHRAGRLNLIIVSHPGFPEAIQSISRTDLDAAIEMVKIVALVSDTRCPVEDQVYERTVV